MPPWLPSFLHALAVCALGLGLLWWLLAGARRFSRRRVLRQRIAAAGGEAARPVLPQTDAGTLYLVPWFLFLGNAQAGVPALLAAAGPLEAPRGDALWRWWRLPALVAIEPDPALIESPAADARWYQALLALAEQRSHLPLNGIVLCLDAQQLLAGPHAADALAQRLRLRVDQAGEHLRVRLPVYLVVTGLARWPGFATLRRLLPPQALAQALGHRLPVDGRDSRPAEDHLDALFEPLMLRLHALRMGLLPHCRTPQERQALHGFIEQVGALQPALRHVAEALFARPRPMLAPRWRGLYLTAADDAGEGAFTADLLARFLPADQPLARQGP